MTVVIGKVSEPDVLKAVWPDVSKIIKEHGKEWLDVVDEKEIWDAIVAKTWELWLGMDDQKLEMVGLCGWECHAKVNYYHIIWLGGKNLAKYLEQALALAEQYAHLSGGTEVVASGRYGWMRLLKDQGYLATTVQVRKNVQELTRH